MDEDIRRKLSIDAGLLLKQYEGRRFFMNLLNFLAPPESASMNTNEHYFNTGRSASVNAITKLLLGPNGLNKESYAKMQEESLKGYYQGGQDGERTDRKNDNRPVDEHVEHGELQFDDERPGWEDES